MQKLSFGILISGVFCLSFMLLHWIALTWNSRIFNLQNGPAYQDFQWIFFFYIPLLLCTVLSLLDTNSNLRLRASKWWIPNYRFNVGSRIFVVSRFDLAFSASLALFHVVWIVVPILDAFDIGKPNKSTHVLDTIVIVKGVGRHSAWASLWDMFLCIFLTLRYNALNSIGITYYQTIPYHRILGWLSVWLLLFHTLLLSLFYIWRNNFWKMVLPFMGFTKAWTNFFGIIGLFSLLIFALVSFGAVRRHSFKTFIILHQLYAIYLLTSIIHVSSTILFILPAVLLVIIERFTSRIISNETSFKAHITRFPDGKILKIDLRSANNSEVLPVYNPGQYIRLSFPSISPIEFHPFSIASSWTMDETRLTVFVKIMGQWGSNLDKLAESSKVLDAQIQGYFDTTSNIFHGSSDCILVCGGVGITSFTPFLLNRCSIDTDSTSRISVLWTCQNVDTILAFSDIIFQLVQKGIHLEVYLTRQDNCETVQIQGQKSNFESIQCHKSHKIIFHQKVKEVFVIVCGFLFGLAGYLIGRSWHFTSHMKKECENAGKTLLSFTQCRIFYNLMPLFLAITFTIISSLLLLSAFKLKHNEKDSNSHIYEKQRLIENDGEKGQVVLKIFPGRLNIKEKLLLMKQEGRNPLVCASGPEALVIDACTASTSLGFEFTRESFLV